MRTLLRNQLSNDEDFHNELCLRLRYSDKLWKAEGEDVLDAVDAYLHWHRKRRWAQRDSADEIWARWWSETVSEVEEILQAGGSMWRVNPETGCLERRVDETVTTAVQAVGQSAPSEASGHLATAWHAAYGRGPDPDKAYNEAVRAVEAMACPLVSPKNDRATLGTVIRDLHNQKSQWELSLTDTTGGPAEIDRLVEMLALLWEGQSRHAGSPNSRRQTPDEGEAAVHLAATLVQWLGNGVLRRRT